jgi:hypothetical protein
MKENQSKVNDMSYLFFSFEKVAGGQVMKSLCYKTMGYFRQTSPGPAASADADIQQDLNFGLFLMRTVFCPERLARGGTCSLLKLR